MPVRIGLATLLLGLGLSTLVGPLDDLARLGDDPSLIDNRAYWRDTLAAGVASFAHAAQSAIGLVAAGAGIEVWRRGKPPVAPPSTSV
ncbi:MAG: hypothetical protein FJ318_06170 [SAR202 cluster bacterium]|nr:hypothetical protein [SAR202 cluster bacterium]